MTGKTAQNHAANLAENKACRNGRLYVYSSYSAVFGSLLRESTLRLAAALSGNGKTIRPATGRQSSAGLTNDGVASNG